MTKLPKEQWFDENIPPDSRVISELRMLVKERGYKSPRALEEEQRQKKKAGTKSGHVRATREKVRRDIVRLLYWNLDTAYRNQPFSTKSIKALHDQYLKVFRREKDNVLDAAINLFLAPFSTALVQGIYDSYQARQDVSPYNFLEAMSSMILNCRKQRGWDRDPLPTNDSFPVGTTWDELRVPLFVQTCVDFHRLSETDIRFLSQVSRETLKKDLKSINIRGRQRTRRSG
jgi:hypothetical protein